MRILSALRPVMKKFIVPAIVLLLFFADGSEGSVVRIHFISVGHGDAILIELDDRALALVDVGSVQSGSKLLEYLRKNEVRHIPHLFATHNHPDHIGAIPLILGSLQVDTIHVTGMVDDWEEALAFTNYLQTGRWAVDTTDIGEVFFWGENLQIEVLSPPGIETAGKTVDNNNNSLVLAIKHGQVCVLLTADIGQSRENWLIERYGLRLRSKALKAPHHGSHAGNSQPFLEMVKPEVAVICIGPNDWGYPSDETVRRLENNCPIVLRTDRDGDVVIQSDGDNITVISPAETEP
jgi:competence protein ComEC